MTPNLGSLRREIRKFHTKFTNNGLRMTKF